MSRVITNFHEQARYAQAAAVEMFDSLTQEVHCWRMFGIAVEWDGLDSIVISLPAHPIPGADTRKMLSMRPSFQQLTKGR